MAFVVVNIGNWFYVSTRTRSALVSGPFNDRAKAEVEAGNLNYGKAGN